MSDVTVELEEGARVEQFFDPFAGEQLSLLALARDRALASCVPRLLAELGELPELGSGRVGFGRHDPSVSRPRLTCLESSIQGEGAGAEVPLLGESRPNPSA